MYEDYITFEDFKKNEIYKDFIEKNPDIGYLKVRVFTAEESIPITNADVLITKDIGSYKVIFYKGKTNKDGMIPSIELPAPKTISTSSEQVPQYTLYEMNVVSEKYEAVKEYMIKMYGNVKVIQYVKMVPIIEVGKYD